MKLGGNFSPQRLHFQKIDAMAAITKQDGAIMTKSELIERLCSRMTHLSAKQVEDAVKTILEHMASSLESGSRIEIRGFGSFSLHFRAPRVGRNPKTGEKVSLEGKHVPHFKPGKELRDRVNIYG